MGLKRLCQGHGVECRESRISTQLDLPLAHVLLNVPRPHPLGISEWNWTCSTAQQLFLSLPLISCLSVSALFTTLNVKVPT